MAAVPLNLSGMFDASPTPAPRSRERVENIPIDVIDNHPRNTTQVKESLLDRSTLLIHRDMLTSAEK